MKNICSNTISSSLINFLIFLFNIELIYIYRRENVYNICIDISMRDIVRNEIIYFSVY